jgi:hypothetical protein
MCGFGMRIEDGVFCEGMGIFRCFLSMDGLC